MVLSKLVLIKAEQNHKALANFVNNDSTNVSEYIYTHRTFRKHEKRRKMKNSFLKE